MRVPTERQLIDQLLTTPRGRVIVCNLIDSVAEKLINRPQLRLFLAWWCKSIPAIAAIPTPKANANPLFDTLTKLSLDTGEWRKLASGMPGSTKLDPAKPDFRLCGQSQVAHHPRHRLATTMRAETFFSYLAGEAKTSVLANLELNVAPDGPRVAWDDAGRVKSARSDRIKPGARLGMKGGVAWYTQASAVRPLIEFGDADGVRDTLGLAHIGPGAHMIAIFFAPAALAADECGRPSALEAGGANGARFMCAPSGGSGKRARTWGQTAHLGRIAQGDTNIDGAPERITKPIDAAQLGKVDIRSIGHISNTRGTKRNESDDAFANILSGQRSIAELKATMLDLIKP